MSDRNFDYDAILPGYYDRVFHEGRGVQSKWHQIKFRRVREALGTPKRHLDIGCGPGTFIGTLPGSIESVGVDIAKPQVDYANEHYRTDGHRFEVVAPGRLPFEDTSFDAVTIIEIIEHLTAPDCETLVQEARRVLTPGGTLILTTPNYASPWPVVEWLLNRLGDVSYEDQHINRFNLWRLSRFLRRVGFMDVESRAYIGVAPFTAALGWRVADQIEQLEPRIFTDWIGLSLMAICRR